MTEVICIVCPKGCHLLVDEENDYAVTQYSCKRGLAYGKKELPNPTRVITSTVKVRGGVYPRCPVKTDCDIPKGKIREAMALLNGIELVAPIHIGDRITADICGTGVNFVATREMKVKSERD